MLQDSVRPGFDLRLGQKLLTSSLSFRRAVTSLSYTSLNYVQDIFTSLSDVGMLTAVAALPAAVETQDPQVLAPLGMWNVPVGILT